MTNAFTNAITRTVGGADSVFRFREIGDGAGTPLIVLNHLNGVEECDPDFMRGLAAHHRIIIFDHVSSSISEMALDAIEFICALGLKLVDLVGYSKATLVIQRIVGERPDLVRRVILAGAVPTGGAISLRAKRLTG
jgi:pimeloyl-ACP methyl ester carboxylesterase